MEARSSGRQIPEDKFLFTAFPFDPRSRGTVADINVCDHDKVNAAAIQQRKSCEWQTPRCCLIAGSGDTVGSPNAKRRPGGYPGRRFGWLFCYREEE
jgi:hypothetical protein